jgi:hypothetical protein
VAFIAAVAGCGQSAGTDPNPGQAKTMAVDAKGKETGKKLPAGAAPIEDPF